MKRIAVTLVLLFVTGVLVYVSVSSGRARDPKPRDAAPPRAESEPRLETVALEPQARLPVKPEEGLESTLTERQGEWATVEAEAGIDLGASLSSRGRNPWKEVEAQVQAAARISHEHDREFVRKIISSRGKESEDDQAEPRGR